jgi:hypothetical protein
MPDIFAQFNEICPFYKYTPLRIIGQHPVQ